MLVLLIPVLLAFTSLLLLATQLHPESTYASTIWALVAACLALLASILALEFIVWRRFMRGILLAREGLLDPVPVAGLGWLPAGKAVREYNATISTLQTMFRTVEECQGRFLNQRNRMNIILQNLPGALLSLADDLSVIMANRQAEELFGKSNGDLIGRNLFDLLRLDEHDRELLRDAFLYKQNIRSQEIKLDGPQGMRQFALYLGFYSDEDNDMAGVLILQDISDYRRLQDSIAQREKLVAMGQLAAGVAHELNTPLGSIHGYAQLLGRATNDPAKTEDYARIIAEEAKRCSRIVQDLLNYAREDRCSGETCDINQLIRDLIETFLNCRMKRYKIQIRLELADQPLVVEGGCGQLDIVLSNLITNAIHALDGIDEPFILITTREEDGHAVISVADNGPGVPMELRGRIFDPFFTTKEVGQGSGLGLPISQAILGKRGGFIMYDSDHKGGARFLMKLPAVDLRRAGL
jgi:PAS domain S-box-containing protein